MKHYILLSVEIPPHTEDAQHSKWLSLAQRLEPPSQDQVVLFRPLGNPQSERNGSRLHSYRAAALQGLQDLVLLKPINR